MDASLACLPLQKKSRKKTTLWYKDGTCQVGSGEEESLGHMEGRGRQSPDRFSRPSGPGINFEEDVYYSVREQ